MTIPRQVDQINAAWLTRALRDAGTLKDGQVTSLTAEPIGVGVGFLGQLARLRITYVPRRGFGIP